MFSWVKRLPDLSLAKMAGLLVSVFLGALSCAVLPGCSGNSSAAADPALDPTLVTLKQGLLKGDIQSNARQFLGIPYAAPPKGDLRWKPPEPAISWTGTRDATQFGSACPQHFFAGDTGYNEDCLYLNVYAPAKVSAGKRPVMVWVHGGAFVNGSGKDFDGSALAANYNVIVVTINYRLGVFGFLALPGLNAEDPHHSSGNYGLMDQQAALSWVHDNIAAFDGDPGNVTLFGESAGADSACDHLLSPLSAGLFQKAIMESGSCTNGVGQLVLQPLTMDAALAHGEDFATQANCVQTDPAEVVACLRHKTANTIYNVEPFGFFPTVPIFEPVVDGYVLPGAPAALFGSGTYNKVPVISGTNHDESRLFVMLKHSNLSDATYPQFIQQIFGQYAAQVLSEYPLSAYQDNPDGEASFVALAATQTDASFSCPAYFLDGLLAANAPVYTYEFADEHAPLFNLPQLKAGAAHSTELLYVFQTSLWGGYDPVSRLKPEQVALSNQMQQYWTQFSATGNPNSTGLPTWPQFSAQNEVMQTLTTTDQGGVRINPDFATFHNCSFWNALAN